VLGVERGQVWVNRRSKRKLDILAVYEGSEAVRYQLQGIDGAKGDAWMSIAMLQEACELWVPELDGSVPLVEFGVRCGNPDPEPEVRRKVEQFQGW
jgi:hypothetical protein